MKEDERLKILRLRSVYYNAKSSTGLIGSDVALIDTISLGHLEGRPLDISSLSNVVRIPRPTVHRHVDRLSKQGWLEKRKTGRHTYIYLTEIALEKILAQLDDAYKLMRNKIKHCK